MLLTGGYIGIAVEGAIHPSHPTFINQTDVDGIIAV